MYKCVRTGCDATQRGGSAEVMLATSTSDFIWNRKFSGGFPFSSTVSFFFASESVVWDGKKPESDAALYHQNSKFNICQT